MGNANTRLVERESCDAFTKTLDDANEIAAHATHRQEVRSHRRDRALPAFICPSLRNDSVRALTLGPADFLFHQFERPVGSGAQTANCDAIVAAAPRVVMMAPEQRGDTEAAMSRELVVVHYDCKTLTVLPECELEGTSTQWASTCGDGNHSFLSAPPSLEAMKLSAGIGVFARVQRPRRS